ncbi:hypothetical protein [Flavobacterium sp.]|uniref:hypothetical protein n=1 Tax=Flavobacterium sp. TaxID=239 RepID=UPI00391A3B56
MHKSLPLIIILFLSTILQSQEANDKNVSTIATAIDDYFFLERENIHLHLNKTTFLSNEKIWFKGYVVNRKTNQPFFNTTNVFALLYDDKGNKLFEKLLFANNGTFTGKFELDKNLHSGDYYIQVYTNWMNNFLESESTIQKVKIINPTEGAIVTNTNPTETLAISLNPEGGSYIKGVSNIVGVKLADCFGNTFDKASIEIQDEMNNVLQTIKLNPFGFGKFEIIPSNSPIKAVLQSSSLKVETLLPLASETGISLEVNNFSFADQVIIKVKTNIETIPLLKDKSLHVIVHQDDKKNITPLKVGIDHLEQTISIANKYLSEGINTIRIIDSDLKQWCERVIYIPQKEVKPINVMTNFKKDGKIKMVGYSDYADANLSISILPEETKAHDIENNFIYASTISPYITENFSNTNYYFAEPNRKKYYELDLVLLNQKKPKYNWRNIVSNPPKSNYTFDIGLTIKGTVNQELKNQEDYKVRLYSALDLILVLSDLNKKNEYQFENIAVADSTVVDLALLKSPELNVISTKFATQVLNRNKPFKKPFLVPFSDCPKPQFYTYDTSFDLPKFNGEIINLNEVVLKTNPKKTLVNENKYGNAHLRGYKIPENDTSSLLGFIEQNGFNVNRTSMGEVSITGRQNSTLLGAATTPEVYLDDRVLFSFAELDMLDMTDIDEIYISSTAIVPSTRNKQGIIKIYRRKNFITKSTVKSTSFMIKQGFERNSSFVNNDYLSFTNKGFENYGIVDWCQTILTDEKGNFVFEFLDANIKKYKIVIQGFTIDGKLINKEFNISID